MVAQPIVGEDLPDGGTREALDAGDVNEALVRLRRQFRTPGFHEQSVWFRQAMATLAALATQSEDPELARMAFAVWQCPSDVESLRELGWALDERELFDMGAAALARANRLAPCRTRILTELVVALEAAGRSDLAVEVLESSCDVLDSSFLCRHLLAYNAVIAGQLHTARAAASVQLPEDGVEGRMADVVNRMIARADLVQGATPLDQDDPRGWHFVTSGGILLHLPHFGVDEEQAGRYALSVDSYERIRYCIGRLQCSLAALDWRPERVMAPDDVASLAVAMATARILHVPLAALDDGPGLVVVYDLARLREDPLLRLSERGPEQPLFTYLTTWAQRSFAPELTGLLCRANVAPWDTQSQQWDSDPPQSQRRRERGKAGVLADRVLWANAAWNVPLAPRDSDENLRSFCMAARPWFGQR